MTRDAHRLLACREASSMEELVTLLKLRHGDADVRLDAYDLKSWHLGLFMETEVRSEPVGYLRVVENGGIADWRVRQLAAQQAGLADASDAAAPLPVLESWPDLPTLRGSYDRHAGLDGRVVEATWLSLTPVCRKLGLDVFLIESTLAAFFFALCVDAAFMTVSVTKQERFEKIGFAVAEGTREVRLGPHGPGVVCMVATPDRVKPLLHACILQQSRRFRAEEQILLDLDRWIDLAGQVA